MCLDTQFPIARCFSFYNKEGAEIACSMNATHNRNITNLTLNLQNLVEDLVDRFCSKKEFFNEFKSEIDIIRLSNNQMSGIKDISSTLFIETPMKHEMNFNRYFIQGNYILPLQKGWKNGMVSETPKKEEMVEYKEYLAAMKTLSYTRRFFATKKKETGDYVHKLILNMNFQKKTVQYQGRSTAIISTPSISLRSLFLTAKQKSKNTKINSPNRNNYLRISSLPYSF